VSLQQTADIFPEHVPQAQRSFRLFSMQNPHQKILNMGGVVFVFSSTWNVLCFWNVNKRRHWLRKENKSKNASPKLTLSEA